MGMFGGKKWSIKLYYNSPNKRNDIKSLKEIGG